MARPRSLPARDRLAVLLSLVPYLLDRGRVSVAEVAQHFDIAEDEVRRAVRLIAVSGVPGETAQYQANDLFDISWDDFEENDHVMLTQQVAIDDSPRFSAREAAALIAGMQYLAALPENQGNDRIAALMGKLSRGASSTPSAVAVARGTGADATVSLIRTALSAGTQLAFDYRNARGETESRVVDPFLIESVDRDWYLRGWDHLREGVRTFRVDRMRSLTDTGSPIIRRRNEVTLSERLFEASASDLVVDLRVAPGSVALLGDYAVDAEFPELPEGERGSGVVVRIRVAHLEGLTRLVASLPGLVAVIAPDAARRAVADWTRAALRANEEEAS
ncbi:MULTISPECIES: helix-turn-helix transcriptional regulator [unclassified Rathayibacter]|uniref:helix-turn-helix transcriptional regulator n=1 Tax=unclassified Rathayibacter TaxID=2609250 RepID=UPI0006FFBBFB|nr:MULTISPECIES: WYL domain-containing protein [unclassified Rathayibacter]KQQ01300.1 DNA-binding transcriptional regulator [Rathayibacter sp. Leaf294]KQS11331.1 DNA-binding transcriptional regulator [Rathayibacter sp. Leaf185]